MSIHPFARRHGRLAPLWLAAVLCLAGEAAAERKAAEGSITRFETSAEAAGKDGAASREDAGARANAPAPREPKACAEAYHASLKRIEKGEFARLETARALSASGDPRLPGMLLLPPRPGSRARPEMAALAAANTAARSKGRAGGATDADSRWISDRLRADLRDYLAQGPSPFLCGGVPAYVETLRRFADRIGSSPDRRAALRETQIAAAQRSISAAMGAMKPVARPRFAPADRPDPMSENMPTGGIDGLGLRPTAGVSRSEQVTVIGTGPADPDLPPLKPAAATPLGTVSDMAAAIDGLLATAKTNGFVTVAANQMAIGGHAGLSPLGFPVLSRIAKAREYVVGPRPLVEDRTARAALTAALSDIEALDYLVRAEAQPGDPIGTSIHTTLDAILSAHAKDCGCGR